MSVQRTGFPGVPEHAFGLHKTTESKKEKEATIALVRVTAPTCLDCNLVQLVEGNVIPPRSSAKQLEHFREVIITCC